MVSASQLAGLGQELLDFGQMFFDGLALFGDAGQIGGQLLPLIGAGGLQLFGDCPRRR